MPPDTCCANSQPKHVIHRWRITWREDAALLCEKPTRVRRELHLLSSIENRSNAGLGGDTRKVSGISDQLTVAVDYLRVGDFLSALSKFCVFEL